MRTGDGRGGGITGDGTEEGIGIRGTAGDEGVGMEDGSCCGQMLGSRTGPGMRGGGRDGTNLCFDSMAQAER